MDEFFQPVVGPTDWAASAAHFNFRFIVQPNNSFDSGRRGGVDGTAKH
jgi:hypothetical protein